METEHILELVRKMRAGDQEAFSCLYDEFSDRIYRFVCLKVSDTGQAEDILQEVFVKTWQGRSSLSLQNLNFSAWLYKVAANTVNDYFRKTYRRPQTVPLDPALSISALDNAQKLTEDGFSHQMIQDALSRLPENYRQVLELRFLQEFSIEETARIMNKNSLAVRVLQHRAVKKLEQIYKLYFRGNARLNKY